MNCKAKHRIEFVLAEMENDLSQGEFQTVVILLYQLLDDKGSREKVINRISAKETI